MKSVCKICRNIFEKKMSHQIYCSPDCYEKGQEIIRQKCNKASKYPYYFCPHCNYKAMLDFDPVSKPLIWDSFKCQGCGKRIVDHKEIKQYEITANIKA
jgi:transcription initiation factor IIE alpha subunit